MKRHKIAYEFDTGDRSGSDKVVVFHEYGQLGFHFPSGNQWQCTADDVRAALEGGTGGPTGFRMKKSRGDLHIEVTPPNGGPSGVVRISASKMRAVIGRAR